MRVPGNLTHTAGARPNRLVFPSPTVRWQRSNSRSSQFATRAVDRKGVLADVRVVVAQQLGRGVEKVKPEDKFSDLGADSLDIVEIMMELEDKFDLQLDEEGSERVVTIKDAAELISSQIEAL